VQILVEEMNQVDGAHCLMPGGSFYVFASVAAICNRLKTTSHGLALYLLEGADEQRGVACLGGESFGEAGAGFLRLSCAQPDDRLREAVAFFAEAITRTDRVEAYLASHEAHRLSQTYASP
jgi:aspartate aminotransferase